MEGRIRGPHEPVEEGELRMLIDDFMEDYVMMDKVSVPDGVGGFKRDWVEGAAFKGALVKNASTEAVIAERQGIAEIFTFTFDKSLPIGYHDVFKRRSDGAVFRSTSDPTDSKTPKVATFQFAQVTAERWELT